MVNKTEVIERTRQWVADFVIGLSICPFAKHPFEKDFVDFQVYTGMDLEECLIFISDQLTRLDAISAFEVETTLIILPNMTAEFSDYLDLLQWSEEVLVDLKLEGIIQIASFHPAYQFAGTQKTDISNYTNRSPYPMIHLLREDGVYEARLRHPDVEGIPQRNIQLLESMDDDKVKSFIK